MIPISFFNLSTHPNTRYADDKLCRTSVKISFPEMRDELFVNFLGYKEPNLVYLWRCKGVCGEAVSPIACAPTKLKEKKVGVGGK